MKKLRYLFVLVLFLVVMPRVYASSVSTSLTGTNSIKVGNTTTIYVKLNSSGGIRGVDLNYSTSGNISLVSAVATGGMTEQSRNGNRVLLYSPNALSSGSSVFAITVKGTAVGTGTVTISRLEATVDGETAVGNSATYTITVNKATTQTTPTKPSTENNKTETEAEKEAKKQALNKATILVEAAERSLLNDDYEAALEAVKALDDSDEKTALLERLDEVRFQIAVKEACNSCKCEEPTIVEETENNDSGKWGILSIVLLLVAIIEFIYIVAMHKKKED